MATNEPHPPKSSPPAPEDDLSFDDRLRRLEEIVGELEDGGEGLEQAIARYQEGIELLKGCHASLDSYRQRVEELTQDAEATMRPFAGDPDADPSEG